MTYRPGNVHGFHGEAFELGIAFYSALAALQGEDDKLRARADALIADAEKRKGAEAQLAALDASADERKQITARRIILAEQIRSETDRRDRDRDAPALEGEDDLAARLSLEASGGGRRIRDLSALQAQPGRSGRTYADLFGKPAAAAADGWKGFEDFLATIASGRADSRAVMATSMGSAVGSDGGFLIPEQFSAEMLDTSLESEIVRPRARVYPMTTDARKIGGFDDHDHTGGAKYGLIARWMGESATNTTQKAKTRLLTLIAHKLAIYANASNELVADGMTFEELLGQAMRNAAGFSFDAAFLNGNGVAKPLGVLRDPALVTVSKETNQPADTILYENLTKMFSRMYPAGVGRSVWVVNQTAIPQLLSLSLPIGTGGTAIPVLQESGGQFSILTRPVIFTEKVPTLGDLGDISLVDFSQYAIGLRKELVTDKSNGPGWFEDETSYRTIVRVDGRGLWSEPLVPANGAATLSWAVTLQAR